MKFFKIISILFLLQGCSSNYEWGWYILSPDNIDGLTNLKFLISGITTTIYISVVSIILAMIIGLIVALPSLSNNKFLSYFNITYVEDDSQPAMTGITTGITSNNMDNMDNME